MAPRKKAAATETSPVNETASAAGTPEQPTLDLAAQVAGASTDIVEYQPHEQAIAAIEDRFKGVVWDVTTTEGMKDAKAARVEIRDVRYALQNTTKGVLVPYQDAVKTAQARVKQVKEFGETLTDRVLAIEDPVHQLIKDEEDRIAAAKAKAEREEAERREAIQVKLNAFRGLAASFAASSAADIEKRLDELKQVIILPEEFGEQEAEATIARDLAIDQLALLHGIAVDREKAAADFKRQQEEMAEMRRKQEESDRQLREQQEATARADRDRLAEQQRELDRQREELRQQQEQQRQRDAQSERDRKELEQLRAQVAAPAPAVAPVVHSVAPAPATLAAQSEARQANVVAEQAAEPAATGIPTASEIVEIVAMSYDVTLDTARLWLCSIQF